MLSPPDAEVARRDRALPGLGVLLDPDAFAGALAQALPAIAILGARAVYVRYKPGTNCLVAYRVAVAGAEIDAYAKLHPVDALEKHDKMRQRGIVLAQPGATAFLFPGDGRLRVLRRLADDKRRRRLVRHLLADAVADAVPDVEALQHAALRTLRYKPERRYVGQLFGANGTAAVVRAYTRRGFDLALMRCRALARTERPPVPRALGALPEHALLAYEWVDGTSLDEAGLASDGVRAAGVALATLHRLPSGDLPHRGPGTEIAAPLEIAASVGILCPHLAQPAGDLARHLADRLAERAPGSALLHGDFDASQCLVGVDGRVTILDLDELHRGDPAADLGTFAAHLERAAICGRLPPDAPARTVELLLDGYACAGGAVARDAVELHTAVALLRLATHAFRERADRWPELTEALVSRVDAIARPRSPVPRHAVCVTRSPVSAPGGVGTDPSLPWMHKALDPAEVAWRLASLAGVGRGGAEVVVCGVRVVRHKPNRRAVIEYDVQIGSTRRTLVGKVRARGADATTCGLLEALRGRGFGPDSPDGIDVPDALGVIEDLGMWVQAKVGGEAASALLGSRAGKTVAIRAAEAVHKIHRLGPPTARRHTMAEEVAILRSRLAMVADARQAWASRLDRVMEACTGLAASVVESHRCGIHRDFYPDHVLVDGSRLHLIDFDLYCEGHPAIDAGNFLAHITEYSLRVLGSPLALIGREHAFRERFVELTGRWIGQAVDACATLALVRHVAISTEIPERRHLTPALLDVCEQRLGLAPGGRSTAALSLYAQGA